MCTDAYREALTRDLSSTASSAPASTPAPRQRHASEAGSGPAMALAKDATVVNGEAIDQR
jgi:hypothetical protein